MQYHGTESTFDVPVGLVPGARIGVRYDGEDPRRSALELESPQPSPEDPIHRRP
jgi:hypothetical protein